MLASYLKHKQNQFNINSIKDINNQTHTKPKEILDCFKNVYEDLYHNDQVFNPDECTNYLSRLNLPKLSDTDRAALGRPLNELEVSITIKSLKDNKAPGPDGFTAKFYKDFNELLLPTMLRVYNNIAEGGTISNSVTEANIVVLPKDGNDPLLPKNFRPISLINVDCKMYAKMLATGSTPFYHNS